MHRSSSRRSSLDSKRHITWVSSGFYSYLGVGEAKTVVVVLFDGETVPGGMREAGGPK